MTRESLCAKRVCPLHRRRNLAINVIISCAISVFSFRFFHTKMAGGETPSGDMFKQASHIWAMLDEMATSDPAAYNKFIKQTMEDSKENIKLPKPFVSLRTSLVVFFCILLFNYPFRMKTPICIFKRKNLLFYHQIGNTNFQ